MSREVRKLQQVGGGTYTVSIPKEWAVEHGMEAGSDVHLYPHADGSLVVRGSESDGDRLARTRLDVTGLCPAATERLLRTAFLVGYDEIVVEAASLTADQRRVVRRATRTLTGTEPVAEGEDRVVLRNLLDASEVSVSQSLVGMRSAVLAVYRTATAAVAAGEAVDRERLGHRGDEVGRSFVTVARHLNRSFESLAELDHLGVDRATLFDYYCAARELREVAAHAVALADLAGRVEEPAADVGTVAEAARSAVDGATTAVVEGSRDGADEAFARRDAARERVDDLERTLAERGGTHALRATDCLRLTVGAGGRIAEAALRRAVREGDDCA
ncbi:MAG: AbrB/MazE/SpoVT family DNA-binding domain-containing protein [Haloferacaceae archaeon]